MALTETTRPYEILIRIHEDGTASGQKQTITEVHRDGVTVMASINAPEELSSAQAALAQQIADGA